MKDYTKTKVCYAEAQADGSKKQYITSEAAWSKILKDAADKKETPPDLIATGTFGFKNATTVDEAVGLAGGRGVGEYENIEVFLGVFNYAADLRQNNESNDILTSDAFVAWEGVKDVSYAVAQKVERSKMSNEEKALSLLSKAGFAVSAEQLRAALQMIASQAQANTASA